MKKLMATTVIMMVLLFSFAANAAKYPATYNCTAIPGGFYTYDGAIKLEVEDAETFLINDQDEAYIDYSYKPKTSFNKTLKKLTGDFESIEGCEHGTSLYLLVNKYIINGAKVGYMKYVCSGEDGYATIMFKCTKF